MNDKGADGPGWAVNAVGWATRNARIAAALCGALVSAAALVFNAGRDYQAMKGQLEVNTIEIRLLRSELRDLRSEVRGVGGMP